MDEASVRLFNVVLLPEEGFPTRPIRGSRGMVSYEEWVEVGVVHPFAAQREKAIVLEVKIRKLFAKAKLVCSPHCRLRYVLAIL